MSQSNFSRRTFLGSLLAGGCTALAGCNWDGHFNLLGYTTKPNYSDDIRTVYVPIFKNQSFQTTPYRAMEMELTRAVIRDIEAKTPFKIISDCSKADTELLGNIRTLNKNILNRNQQNEVREGEVTIGVELVWRDLRSGEVLSNPPKPIGIPIATELPPFDPDNLPLGKGPERPIPVLITFGGRYLPEVGETNASAQTRVCNKLAIQIVNMMEKEWQLPPRTCP